MSSIYKYINKYKKLERDRNMKLVLNQDIVSYNGSNRLKKFLNAGMVMIWPALIVFVIEWMQRNNYKSTVDWMMQNGSEAFFNYLLSFLLNLLMIAVTGYIHIGSFIYSVLALLFSIINVNKMKFLGEPFYPWDFLMARNILNLLRYLYEYMDLMKSVLLVFLFVLFYFIVRNRKFSIHIRWVYRVIVGIISASAIFSIAFYEYTPVKSVIDAFNIERIMWEQKSNYEKNGMLLSFILNTEFAFVKAPEGYGEALVAETVNEIIQYIGNDQKVTQSMEKPDIILIMDEAFWDPTSFNTILFENDPIPTIRQYQSGSMLSPTFGGSTANVEFEVLTGFNNAFFNRGSIPYQQYIHKPIPSLVSILKDYGYMTTAIHPYYNWYYRREKVYIYLGFHQFIHLENFDKSNVKGHFISDEQVFQKIIEHLQTNSDPSFIFAITMQNHGPYEKNRYEDEMANSIQVLDGNIPDDSLDMLNTYTQGVMDADRSFRILVDYVSNRPKPTIIVFFGDHLPYLGENYALYSQAGFIAPENWTLEDIKKIRSVPLVIYSNYMDMKDTVTEVSPSFLFSKILKMADIKVPVYYQFLEQLSNELPVFLKDLVMDVQGSLYEQVPEEFSNLIDAYRVIQYDILFDLFSAFETE